MEVGYQSENRHDESDEAGHWMHDEDGRQCRPGRAGQVEITFVAILIDCRSVVAYLDGTACGASTPAKDTETDSAELAKWYLLNDRGRQDRDQEQAKSQEEQNR